MTRTLFFLMALTAMLAAMTAVLLRIELAAPGLSPLFTGADGQLTPMRFDKTSLVHSITCYLTVMLLGTTFAAAARERGALFSSFVLWIGIVSCVATAVLAVLTFAPWPGGFTALQESIGWIEAAHLGLDITDTGSFDPFSASGANSLSAAGLLPVKALAIPAAFLVFAGLYVALGSIPNMQWVVVAGLLATFLASMIALQSLFTMSGFDASLVYVIAALPFIPAAAIRVTDTADPWLIILLIGLPALIIGETVAAMMLSLGWTTGTMAEAALEYVFPLGLAWFALPALVLYRSGRPLPEIIPWMTSAALSALLILWILPMIRVGQEGQLRGYADFPDPFAAQNASISFAVFAFVLLYLAILTALRRSSR